MLQMKGACHQSSLIDVLIYPLGLACACCAIHIYRTQMMAMVCNELNLWNVLKLFLNRKPV